MDICETIMSRLDYLQDEHKYHNLLGVAYVAALDSGPHFSVDDVIEYVTLRYKDYFAREIGLRVVSGEWKTHDEEWVDAIDYLRELLSQRHECKIYHFRPR